MNIIKQSTAITVALGPFLDSTDGITAETALTLTQPDIRLSKNGAAFAQKAAAQTLTHMENGYYSLSLDATDTNTVGTLRVHVIETGALPVFQDFQVVEEAVYEQMFAASAPGAATVAALATVDTEIGVIDGIVDAILVDTAEIGAAGAGLTALATQASVNTIDTEVGVIDGIVDSILEDTGTTIPATLTTIDNEIGAIDTVVDSILVDTAEIGAAGAGLTEAGGTGDQLTAVPWNAAWDAEVQSEATDALNSYDPPTKAEMDSGFATLLDDLGEQTRVFTAQAGGASTITLDAGASAVDDFYNGGLVILLDGTGTVGVTVSERTRRITDYVGSTKVATVDAAWDTNPDNTSRAIIFGKE